MFIRAVKLIIPSKIWKLSRHDRVITVLSAQDKSTANRHCCITKLEQAQRHGSQARFILSALHNALGKQWNNSAFGAYINYFISVSLTHREWILKAHFMHTALIQSQKQLGGLPFGSAICEWVQCWQVPSGAIQQRSGKIFLVCTEYIPVQSGSMRAFCFLWFTVHMSSCLQCPIMHENAGWSCIRENVYLSPAFPIN